MPQEPGPGESPDLVLAAYDAVERLLLEVIERPHWKVRRGKLVLDADGEPVPDPAPARKAQQLLGDFRRNRARLGPDRTPRERNEPAP